jgi:hypothetical protein
MDRTLVAWQNAVFDLYLAEEKIEPEVVKNMRSWQHSGFSVDQSVYLPARDKAGSERLIQCMTRYLFGLYWAISDQGRVSLEDSTNLKDCRLHIGLRHTSRKRTV